MERKVHKKRVLSWILSLVMVMTLGSPAYAVEIDDGTQPETNVSDEMISDANTDENVDVGEDDSDADGGETSDETGDETSVNPNEPAVDSDNGDSTDEEPGAEGEEPSNEEDEQIDPVEEEPQAEEVPVVVEETAPAVAKVGDQSYESLADAIEAAEGKTVTLTHDVELNECLRIDTDNVTLDLAGHTISKGDSFPSSEAFMIRCQKTLTIQDSGASGKIDGGDKIAIYTTGTLKLESGEITSGSSQSALYFLGAGKAEITDGKVQATATNGKAVQAGQGYVGTITVMGGQLIGVQAAVYVSGGSVIVSDNAKLIGTNFGVWMENATLSVSGGSIRANQNDAIRVTGGSTLTVTDGMMTGERLGAYITGTDNTLSISGGTLSGLQCDKDNKTNFVTGGTFTNRPSGDGYLAEGYYFDSQNTVCRFVASISDTVSYGSLSEAITKVANRGTVTLLCDVTESVTVPEGKTITLDLNGKTLTNTEKQHTITNNGTLTIVGEGTVDNVSHGKAAVYNAPKAMVTLNSGTYDRTEEKSTSANLNGGNSFYTLQNQGTMIINSGVKVQTAGGNTGYGRYSSLVANGYQDGSQNSSGTNAKLEINGGEFSGGINTVKNDECGELLITDGTFRNYVQHSLQNWNIATVKGGNFIAENTPAVYNGVWGEYAAGNLTITGGIFDSGIANVIMTDLYSANAETKISGGTFSSDVSEYCADGYAPAYDAETGKYTVDVLGEGNAAASVTIGETTSYYATLNDAFAAATSEAMVKLLKDAHLTNTLTVQAEQSITFDLNGCAITVYKNESTGRSLYAIDNYGTFTLMDSKENGLITARGIENLGNGQMTIESGKIVSCDSNGGACIWNQANVTINGGVFETVHVGTSSDGIGIGCLNNKNGKALITGGTFKDVNRRAYAIISTGEIEITPAVGKEVIVHGAHGGLAIDSGTAVVNGGSYSSDDYYGLYVSNDGLGEDPLTAVVTVNGGTFSGKAYSVWVGSDYNNPVNSTIVITNGTFEKPLNAQEVAREGAIQVSGGMFSAPVEPKYCADGFVPVTNSDSTGMYTVKKAVVMEYMGSSLLKKDELTKANIRLTYTMTLPEDWKLTDISWKWKWGVTQDLSEFATITGSGYVETDKSNVVTTNMGLKNIPLNTYYNKPIYVQMIAKNGTIEDGVFEDSIRPVTIADVVNEILNSADADAELKQYAQNLKNMYDESSSSLDE